MAMRLPARLTLDPRRWLPGAMSLPGFHGRSTAATHPPPPLTLPRRAARPGPYLCVLLIAMFASTSRAGAIVPYWYMALECIPDQDLLIPESKTLLEGRWRAACAHSHPRH
jgi:hypothetical protein